jgi:hypothetical protein
MKIWPVGAQFFNADGQRDGRTNITKLIIDFRNFAYTPTNLNHSGESHHCSWVVQPVAKFPKTYHVTPARAIAYYNRSLLIKQLSVILCGFINIPRKVSRVGCRYLSRYNEVQYPKPN